MNKITETAASRAGDVLNLISDITGIRCVREKLPHPRRRGCRTLEIPGYRQTQSYTCGFIVTANVIRLFDPSAPLEPLYDDLDQRDGTNYWQVTSVLRKHGVKIRKRTTLDFTGIRAAIDAGKPVICSVKAMLSGHWVVIYGYDRERKTLFVCGNGQLPWLNRKEISYERFHYKWDPVGNGLVCSARRIVKPRRQAGKTARVKK